MPRTPHLRLLAALLMTLPYLLRAQQTETPLTDRERMLLERIARLEERVAALEKKTPPPDPVPATVAATPATQSIAPQAAPTQTAAATLPSLLGGTTLNLALDAYYSYNTNNPIGRVNLLRAYDVSSNAISLNQAGVIFENQPHPKEGKRWGFRLDFQYGQATETLQGNPLNEPRPDIYRSIFQAYGTYVLPIGRGLTVDFGKFASSLGYEGNYTKDQLNYSRGFWFNFLPFYHQGARLSYQFSNAIGVNYWVVNGTQQTEPFNGYKDELFGLTIRPNKRNLERKLLSGSGAP